MFDIKKNIRYAFTREKVLTMIWINFSIINVNMIIIY